MRLASERRFEGRYKLEQIIDRITGHVRNDFIIDDLVGLEVAQPSLRKVTDSHLKDLI